jgi:hypothetical protein
MAKSRLARRQEAERQRTAALDASLRRVCQRRRPTPDLIAALDDALRGFETEIVRPPDDWRPQIKSRDPDRLRLLAARHLYARYPVAEHLERIWLDARGLDRGEVRLRKFWYVTAASGGSLYKAGAREWLSRAEVHAFLNPPARLDFEQAFWLAVARSYTGDLGLALRIARSAIGRRTRVDFEFWRQVVRFFCTHPTSLSEIDDLSDWIAECQRRDPGYRLQGRTLASLGRQMKAWHDDLAAIARIEEMRARAEATRARAEGRTSFAMPSKGGSWPGAGIADWSWQPSAKDRKRREEYVVVQLRSAATLVEETRAMQHCVATYASKCIAGLASIWSLRHINGGTTTRLLTIELDSRFRAIQVRGFANRMAHLEERKILERWAKARGIDLV